MTSINNSVYQLHIAKQNTAKTVKTAKTAAQTASFQSLLKDTYYADSVAKSNAAFAEPEYSSPSLNPPIIFTKPNYNAPAPNTSLRWYDDNTKVSLAQVRAIQDMSLRITIGKNQLPELMSEIENALAKGDSWISAVKKLYNSNYQSQIDLDNIHVDPFTGNVTHATPFMGGWKEEEGKYAEISHSSDKDDAVWDLAYDLQQFLKLRVFGETGGMSSDEVERAIADIKDRQGNKDTWRFDKVTQIKNNPGKVVSVAEFMSMDDPTGYGLAVDKDELKQAVEFRRGLSLKKMVSQNADYDKWIELTRN